MSTTYDLSNAAIRIDGRIASFDYGGNTPVENNATLSVVINGTDASMAVYAYYSSFAVSVDGGAESYPSPTATSAVGSITLFSGLTPGWHVVVVRALDGYVEKTALLTVSGGTEAIRAVSTAEGFGPSTLVASTDFATYGQIINWPTFNSAFGLPKYKTAWANAAVRRRVYATGAATLSIWTVMDGSNFAVYLDGAKIAFVSAPDESAGGTLTVWRWLVICSNVDLSLSPELRVIASSPSYFGGCYIDAVMVVGDGAAFPATALAPMNTFLAWGDSKTYGYGVGDKSTNLTQLLADGLGLLAYNYGVTGDTEVNAMANRAGELTGMSPAPQFVLDRFAYNDNEDATDFQAAVASMISAARTAYPDTLIVVCGADVPPGSGTIAERSAPKQAAVLAANDVRCIYVDMSGLISNSPAGTAYDTVDGIHETAQGYAKEHAHLQPIIAAALVIAAPVITSAATANLFRWRRPTLNHRHAAR